MKKLLFALLVVVMIISVSACASKNVTSPTPDTNQPQTNPDTNQNIPQNTPDNQQSGAVQNDVQDAVGITKEKAIELALAHANVKSTDVNYSKAELDYDDGKKHYDVEFYSAGFEYDYEIDSTTGEILKFEKEKE